MKQSVSTWTAGIKLSLFSVAAVLVGVALISTSPGCRRYPERASLAEALNNARQVKFALDGFATDFNGHFPSEATGRKVVPGGTGTASSNDYLRQLFLSGETLSEAIFWSRRSPVASKEAPDDEVLVNDEPKADLILQPGDCHWAYMTGQTNTSNVARPLLLDPFDPKTGEWDPDLWDRKTVIVRVDGSAKAMRMRVSDNLVLDGSNQDILSPDADAWRAEPGEPKSEDPRKLLVQPALAPSKR